MDHEIPMAVLETTEAYTLRAALGARNCGYAENLDIVHGEEPNLLYARTRA